MIEKFREYHWVSSERRKLHETGYAAITYTDHFSDGRKATGTEDFSSERFRCQVVNRVVWERTDRKNRGGKFIWERIGSVSARTSEDCGKIARMVYGDRIIRIRQY